MKSKIASIFCILAGVLSVNLFAAAQSEPAAPACEAEVERLASALENLREQYRAIKARADEALITKNTAHNDFLLKRAAYREACDKDCRKTRRDDPESAAANNAEFARLEAEKDAAKENFKTLRDAHQDLKHEKDAFHQDQIIPARDAKRSAKRNCREVTDSEEDAENVEVTERVELRYRMYSASEGEIRISPDFKPHWTCRADVDLVGRNLEKACSHLQGGVETCGLGSSSSEATCGEDAEGVYLLCSNRMEFQNGECVKLPPTTEYECESDGMFWDHGEDYVRDQVCRVSCEYDGLFLSEDGRRCLTEEQKGIEILGCANGLNEDGTACNPEPAPECETGVYENDGTCVHIGELCERSSIFPELIPTFNGIPCPSPQPEEVVQPEPTDLSVTVQPEPVETLVVAPLVSVSASVAVAPANDNDEPAVVPLSDDDIDLLSPENEPLEEVQITSESDDLACQAEVERLKSDLANLRERHRANRAKTQSAWEVAKAARSDFISKRDDYREACDQQCRQTRRNDPESPEANDEEFSRLEAEKNEAKARFHELREEYRRIKQEKKDFRQAYVIPARDAKRLEAKNCKVSSLSRDASKVGEESDADALGDAVAQLGVASAGFAPVSEMPGPSAESNPNRLPEYAAPVALIGVLAFSSFYPDYELGSSFNYSGENGSLDWEAEMRGSFAHGSFSSYVSAIQDNGRFLVESGTTYQSNSFFASYRTIEAKDYMNYEVQLSVPWKYSKWEIKPNLSSEFHYDRDENHSSSETGAGLDLEYRF